MTEPKDVWYLEKIITICASHKLRHGKCSNLHGHNWKVTVRCKGEKLDPDGMVIDFGGIKFVVDTYDHCHLNDHAMFTDGSMPTAENLAKKIYQNVCYCYEVEVEETAGCKVIYRQE